MKLDIDDIKQYKNILRELGITHQEVADYIGFSRVSVTTWLDGRNKPTLKTAIHVSKEIDRLIFDHKIKQKLKSVACKKTMPKKIELYEI